MKKFLLATTAVATSAMLAFAPTAQAATFQDIGSYNANTQNEITTLAELGIIKGVTATTFQPNNVIKRSHVVKMLGRFLVNQGYATIPADAATKQRYTDVSLKGADKELIQYAAVVKDYGVFNGTNGALNPSGEMSRQNMVLVLSRVVDAIEQQENTLLRMAEGKTANVTDLAKAKAESRELIRAFSALGLSNTTTFNPTNTVKRVQFASFMYRIMELLEDEQPATPGTYTAKDMGLASISRIDATDGLGATFTNGQIQVAQTTNEDPDLYFELIDVFGKTLFGHERMTPAYFFAETDGKVYLDQYQGVELEVPVAAFKLDKVTSFSYTTANGTKDEYAVLNLGETLALNDAIGVNNIVTLTVKGTYGGSSVTRTIRYYFNGLGEIIFDTPRQNVALNYHYELIDTGDVIVDGAIQTAKKLYYFPVSETAGWDQVAFSADWTIADLQKLTGVSGEKSAVDFAKHDAVLIVDDTLTNYGVKSIYFMDEFFTPYTVNATLPVPMTVKSIEVMGSVIAKSSGPNTLALTIVGDKAEEALLLVTATNGREYVFGLVQQGTNFVLEDLSDLGWEM
ncbi:S-layer homology domain-containing protein [Caryophanon tenue]|uniref:SLH domain-containing protein n=1 Tax=Caryophanon tenue TaxID=33978 RepID=A0A1C0YNG2_9BACL|nr:S-layer homology domain-containing protein [Caryophanon tenue]OCS88720.1 hypothetical protein A6M13_02430 [Caryophanon tenue]